jgi:WD40 repeat protein
LQLQLQSQSKASVISDIGLTGADWVQIVAFSPDNKLIASVVPNGIMLWSISSGRSLRRLENPAYVMSFSFSPDSRRLAASYKDGKVRTWDVTSGKSQTFSMLYDRPMHGPVAFNAQGSKVYSADESGNIYIWDLVDSRNHRKFNYGKRKDWPLRLDELREMADGKRLLAVSRDWISVSDKSTSNERDTIRIFDSSTGELMASTELDGNYSFNKIVGDGFIATKKIGDDCQLEEISLFSLSDMKTPSLMDKRVPRQRP